MRRAAHRRSGVQADRRVDIHDYVGEFESVRIGESDLVNHNAVAIGIERDEAGTRYSAGGSASGGGSTIAMGIRTADHNKSAGVNVIGDTAGLEVHLKRYAGIAADRYPREADGKPRTLRNLTGGRYAGCRSY